MKKKVNVLQIALFIIMTFYSIVSLYPLVWVVIQSFKTESEFLLSIWTLPSRMNFANYVAAWNKANFSIYFINSVTVTVTTLVLVLSLTAVAGFAFAKLNFIGKKFLFNMIIVNLMIPTAIILLPMFFLIKDLGIKNTLPALIFPYFTGTVPLGLIITTSYYKGLPDELLEAARIDGCSFFQSFLRIILPLGVPIMATQGILAGMSTWNEYMWALISISEKSRYTIPVGITVLQGARDRTGYVVGFAALTLSSIVIVVLYLFSQKFFVKSIAAGAVKG